jgi:hypothetical protein
MMLKITTSITAPVITWLSRRKPGLANRWLPFFSLLPAWFQSFTALKISSIAIGKLTIAEVCL